MNSKLIIRMLVALELVVLAGVVVHAPLSVWLGVQYPEYSLLIKTWKEIALGLCLLFVCFLVTRAGKWRVLLTDTVMRVAAGYAALHVALLAWQYQGAGPALAGLLIDLRIIVIFVVIYTTLYLFPQYRRLFVIAGVSGAAVVLGFAGLQLTVLPVDVLRYIGYDQTTILPYLTVDLNNEYVRINSTLRGPNPLGAYAGAAITIIAAYIACNRLRLSKARIAFVAVLAACSLAALWVSYSRSSMIGAVCMLLAVIAAVGFHRIPRRWLYAGIGAIGVTVIVVAASWNTPFVSNVIRHSNPAGGSAQKSDDGHALSLRDGAQLMLVQPLGAGIGSAGSASLQGSEPLIIENHYLFIAHETGWLGLGLFAWLFGLIIKRLYNRRADWLSLGLFASGVGLAVIGIFLPVWADDTVGIVWWGLAAVALAPVVKGGNNARKPTSK